MARPKKLNKKIFTNLVVSDKCKQEFQYTSRILNKPLSVFMSEISSLMIQITAILESANVSYVLDDDSLLIKFDGDSRIITGRLQGVSDAEVDAKMQELTQLKIAEDLKREIHIKRDAEAPNIDSHKHSAKFYKGLD
jgi:hypothetical protein